MKIISLIFFFTSIITIKIKEIHQVIIIGAGISGLRASQVLAQQNIPHLVLESTDHLGGRITSIEFQGLKLDKGASFIHDSKNHNPLGKFVELSNQTWIDGTCSYKVMYEEGKKQGPIQAQDITEARIMYKKLVNTIENNLEDSADISVAQATKSLADKYYPNQSQIRRRLVDFMFRIQGNIDGAQISKISAKMRSYKETKFDIMASSGFHNFLKQIFPSIKGKILFNQRVHTVDYSSELIKVMTNKQTFYAKKVISSLPLGILKAGKVKFSPALPVGHQKSIHNIGNGYADKLFVSFEKPFWGNRTGWISFVTKNRQNKYPVAFILPTHIYKKHLLIIFVSGESSLKISKWSYQQIIDDVHDFLRLYFQTDQIQVQAVELTRWHMDQNALGSYSNYKVGTTENDFLEISKPIDDRIWFIGQHTVTKINSYVHGAYVSGEEAGYKVAVSLKKRKTQAEKVLRVVEKLQNN